MNIAVIGAGYVGLTTAACLACVGHRVSCFEIDAARLASVREGRAPFYEPGLTELVAEHSANGRLRFFGDIAAGIAGAEIVFLAVGTPSAMDGSIDTTQVMNAAEAIAACGVPNITVVNRCTCPPGTGAEIKRITGGQVIVLANPEFLREGSAVNDFMNPDRIIVGADNPADAAALIEIYEQSERPVIVTSIASAELMKFAANAYLASSISFINGIAGICGYTGADIREIEAGLRADHRIGENAMLSAGAGYGGGCLPKDVSGLAALAKDGSPFQDMLNAVTAINDSQRSKIVRLAREICGGLTSKSIGIWGLSFKPGSDDIRESAAIAIAGDLLARGAFVTGHDPAAAANAKIELPGLGIAATPEDAAAGAEILLVLTAWPEYSGRDMAAIRESMTNPVIIDGRNLFDPAEMTALGFRYLSMGRNGNGA